MKTLKGRKYLSIDIRETQLNHELKFLNLKQKTKKTSGLTKINKP